MEINYYRNEFYYYINGENINNIFLNSEFSDIKKYNIIKLLTYYLIYNYISFETLEKLLLQYNIKFKKIKPTSDKTNNYLCFIFNYYIIKYNIDCLLNYILLCKKHNIVKTYLNLLFNSNKYLNKVKCEIIKCFMNKLYLLNLKYYENNKYLKIEKKYSNIIKNLLISKHIYYNIQCKIITYKCFKLL